MASAFISYAHEDQEFVLSLVDQLQGLGLDVRYDQVALQIGDSLIRVIAQEIAEGDFLIAVVSPDSAGSEWCQTELALARTQGINDRRVKVLPVRFRGALMPPMLQDTFWGDADRYDVETIARKLAAAMQANLEGREADATREAEAVEDSGGDRPHRETPADVDVAQIEDVAQRTWDVFEAWSGVWDGGNMRDLDDPQRRLRWVLDVLPERLRQALPLVRQIATADLNELFGDTETRESERQIREELFAARTRVAQGLPIIPRWLVVGGEGEVSAGNRDAVAYLWTLQRGQDRQRITVYISGTAMASGDNGLPDEVVAAKNTRGRSVLASLVGLDAPPREVMVTTAGLSLSLPD
jgi:hypothetical protein